MWLNLGWIRYPLDRVLSENRVNRKKISHSRLSPTSLVDVFTFSLPPPKKQRAKSDDNGRWEESTRRRTKKVNWKDESKNNWLVSFHPLPGDHFFSFKKNFISLPFSSDTVGLGRWVLTKEKELPQIRHQMSDPQKGSSLMYIVGSRCYSTTKPASNKRRL